MKFLVCKAQYSFDGHGDPLLGSEEYFITKQRIFAAIGNEYCNEDIECVKNKYIKDLDDEAIERYCRDNGYINDEDALYAQDGYHSTAYVYTAIAIDPDKIPEIQTVINNYLGLMDDYKRD